jgi:hypothetical protein
VEGETEFSGKKQKQVVEEERLQSRGGGVERQLEFWATTNPTPFL